MADIILVCPMCAKHVAVSEYVESGVSCPQCGRLLDRNTPVASSGTKPKLASMVGRGSLISDQIKPEEYVASELSQVRAPQVRHAHGLVHAEFMERLHYLLSWLVFLVLLGLLLYWQWKGQSDPQLLGYYKIARWVLAGGAWLAILIVAFQENWVQGTLNLLVPAYSVYYALNKLDYFYLRAVYFAILLMLAAEFYFLPDQTVFHLAQQALSHWTDSVRDLIRNTGRKITTT
ncbi:MAG: hypothetical protein NTY53_23120 [Kiritimatiellaeota bacterium]|nr:hypothetical protein [Kiritimatiellota bacterium]